MRKRSVWRRTTRGSERGTVVIVGCLNALETRVCGRRDTSRRAPLAIACGRRGALAMRIPRASLPPVGAVVAVEGRELVAGRFPPPAALFAEDGRAAAGFHCGRCGEDPSPPSPLHPVRPLPPSDELKSASRSSVARTRRTFTALAGDWLASVESACSCRASSRCSRDDSAFASRARDACFSRSQSR